MGNTFTAGAEGYLGFKLNGANFGWMRVVFTNNTGGAVIKDWAYDNSGAPIVVGSVQQGEAAGGAQLVTLSPATSEAFTLGSLITDTGGNTNSVLKTGAGTTTLTGANSYTGTTTINSGMLVVNNTSGSGTGTGTVTVNNAGTRLAGTGSISGNTTINAGAIHSPGNSPGIQKFTGNLTYADASVFEWEIDRTQAQTRGLGYDAVNVTGMLAGFDGDDDGSGTDAYFRIVIGDSNFNDSFWDTNKSWNDIFTDSNGTTAKSWASIFGGGFQYYYNNGTSLTSIQAPDANTVGYFTMSDTTLTWTAVPEPSSALAAFLLGAGLLRRRRAGTP